MKRKFRRIYMRKYRFVILMIIQILLVSYLFSQGPVALTLNVKGNVDLNRDAKISDVKKGDELLNNDELISMENSYAAIKFIDESSIIKLFPNSSLKIHIEEENRKIHFLKMGELWTKVTKSMGEFIVETPTTVASVKGTEFLLSLDENGNTDIFTFAGEVLIKNKFNNIEALIKAGQKAHSDGSSAIKVLDIEPSDIDKNTQKYIDKTFKIKEKGQKKEDEIGRKDTGSSFRGEDKGKGKGFQMGGAVGTIMMGDNVYTRIRLMPEITFGKIGIGLDFDLLIDSDGNIKEDEWDEFKDYANKIYYIRYGHRSDPFFGRIGGFPAYSLGHGLVMRDYSNMLRYPEVRQIGLQLGGKIPVAGLELEGFTSNLTENEILAGRVTFLPLGSTEIPLLKNIRFGSTIAHDRNQIKGLIDSDDDEYPDVYDDYPYNDDAHNEVDEEIDFYRDLYFELHPDSSETAFQDWFEDSPTLDELRNSPFSELGEDDVTVIGVDYELPLISNKVFYLSHYSEVAKILDHNMGFIFPGFYSKFLIFHANLEFRFYQEDFIPAFFDELYDEQRAVAYHFEETGLDSVETKEDKLIGTTETKGWYGSLTADLFHLLFLTVSYEDMYGKDDVHYKSLWGKASVNTDFVPKFSRAEISYSQTGFDKLEHFKNPSALVTGTLGYDLGGNTELVGKYQERYVDYDGNGEINGKEETIKTMGFGVEFRF